MNNEQSGTYAMINPQIDNDPAKRQGEIGLIVDANLERDDIWVSFGRDKVGLYSTNALMVLNKHEQISQNAMDKRFEITGADFKKLMEISLLTQSGRPEKMKAALEMAGSNETLLKNSTSTLQDRLGLVLNYEAAQSKDMAIARGR